MGIVSQAPPQHELPRVWLVPWIDVVAATLLLCGTRVLTFCGECGYSLSSGVLIPLRSESMILRRNKDLKGCGVW